MFGFLKEKLKSWFGKSKEDIVEKAEKKESLKKEPGGKERKKAEKALEKLEKKEKKLKKKISKEEKKEKLLEKEEESLEKEIEKEKKIFRKEEHLERAGKEIEIIEKDEERLEEVGKEVKKEEEKIQEAREEIKTEEKQKEKLGFFARLKKIFSYSLTQSAFDEIFSDLELLLLESSVALEVVEKIRADLQQKLVGKELKKDKIELEIKESLKESINSILTDPEDLVEVIKERKKFAPKELAHQPFKILFFGINGSGKTTSIAKLANLLLKNNLSVVLAAADTFRAASIEQISIHAERLGINVIKHDYGSDPSAVAFDAIKYAEQNKIDAVIIDTAGRMHTKENLLHEMEKISRVTKPNLKVFVAEAVAGNDATEQAKTFNEMIGIDGSILSKVDVDEKGGAIISISHATKKPILYIGTGQNYNDLELFSKKKFIERLGL